MLISATDKKVYDVAALHNFCSRECASKSYTFSKTISVVSLCLRRGNPDGSAGEQPVASCRDRGNSATVSPRWSLLAAPSRHPLGL